MSETATDVPEDFCICAEVADITGERLTNEQVIQICGLHWQRMESMRYTASAALAPVVPAQPSTEEGS